VIINFSNIIVSGYTITGRSKRTNEKGEDVLICWTHSRSHWSCWTYLDQENVWEMDGKRSDDRREISL